jgi:hypothetical protein
MASQTTPRLLVELATHSVQLALVDAGGRLAGVRRCAVDAGAVAAALAELSPGASVTNVQALLVPSEGFVVRSTAEEAASMRTVKSLLARAESAALSLTPPLSVVAFDSASGRRVDTVGAAPWVLAGAATELVDAAKAQLTDLGLPAADVGLALPVSIGAVVAALQDMPESTRVLVWQIGETDARLACISAGGCEAAGVTEAGFTQIFEAVQAGLGLKFRAAASKLFFNDSYDFSETAGPVAERIAAALRPAITALGCAPTVLHVSGLPAGQAWLAKAVASALDLAPLSPDMAAFCAQRGLTGPGVTADLPASALGLLFKASGGGQDEQTWQPGWLDINAPVPVVAPAPAPKAVAPAPAPEVKAPVAPKPAPVAPAPKPAPVSVPAAPVPVAAAPAPAAKPAPAPVAAAPAPAPAPAPAKPAPAPNKGGKQAPAQKPITPAPVIKPAAPEPVATIPPTQPAPAPVAEAPVAVAAPAHNATAAKKKPVALFAAIAAVVVLGGVGAVLMTGNSGGGDEKAPAAPVAETQVEQRLREEEMARMLAEELKTPRSFRNERYSFEVSDRGFLRKLVGVGNRTIIDEFGWLELQGTFTGTSKPFYAGTISDNEYVPSINKTIKDGRVVFEIKGKHPRFSIETLVTCLPTSLRIHTVFTPIDLEEARGPISGVYMVKMNRQSLSLGQRAEVAPGSVTYSTQSGPVVMKFNGDAWGQAGEAGKQTVAVGSNLVFFYFAGGTDPKHNVLTTELTLP